MNVTLVPDAPVVPPPVRVLLDLSVEEFAMLDALRYTALSHDCMLRTSIDRGFSDIRALLGTEYRDMVLRARDSAGNARVVQDIFAGAS